MAAILPQHNVTSANRVAQSLQVAASTAALLQKTQLGTSREESLFMIPFETSDADLEVSTAREAAYHRRAQRRPCRFSLSSQMRESRWRPTVRDGLAAVRFCVELGMLRLAPRAHRRWRPALQSQGGLVKRKRGKGEEGKRNDTPQSTTPQDALPRRGSTS